MKPTYSAFRGLGLALAIASLVVSGCLEKDSTPKTINSGDGKPMDEQPVDEKGNGVGPGNKSAHPEDVLLKKAGDFAGPAEGEWKWNVAEFNGTSTKVQFTWSPSASLPVAMGQAVKVELLDGQGKVVQATPVFVVSQFSYREPRTVIDFESSKDIVPGEWKLRVGTDGIAPPSCFCHYDVNVVVDY